MIRPVSTGPTIEEPLSVMLKIEKKIDSLPEGIIRAKMDLDTAFRAPMDSPYQTARKYISNLCFRPILSNTKPRIPYSGMKHAQMIITSISLLRGNVNL